MNAPKLNRSVTVLLAATLLFLAGCGFGGRHTPQDCMERAMFFESNRSSRDGMIAVGSVVMNRVASRDFPNSVCGVVGQRRQFAPGIMTRRMNSKAMPDVREKLSDLGLAAQSSTPQQFADLIRTETDKVAKIVKDAGIKFE